MELWFWLWIYDYRWIIYPFASKAFYQFVWIIPLLVNLIFVPVTLIYLFKQNSVCSEMFISHIYARLSFTVILSIMIIIFMINMTIVYNKQNRYYQNLNKIYTTIDLTNLPKNTYWTRNKILKGVIGILLLILSCINIIWTLYFKIFIMANIENCNYNLVRFVDIHSMITIIGNIPVGFFFFTNFLIKIVCFIMSVTCPRVMVLCSKLADKPFCRSKVVSNRRTFQKKEMLFG